MTTAVRAVLVLVTMSLMGGCARSDAINENLFISGIFAQRPGPPQGLVGDPHFVAALMAETTLARRDFVPRSAKGYAGAPMPLPIGWEQTISDPYIVAVMTAATRVRRGSRVLEVGTGSGYQAAVLSRLGAKVSTIEIVPALARRAARTLRRLGMRDVAVRQGDGFAGWEEHAPFDAVIVTAGATEVPAPLLAQLAPEGFIVMPIGPDTLHEQLVVIHKEQDVLVRCTLGPASFVPLTGRGRAPARAVDRASEDLPPCYGEAVT